MLFVRLYYEIVYYFHAAVFTLTKIVKTDSPRHTSVFQKIGIINNIFK